MRQFKIRVSAYFDLSSEHGRGFSPQAVVGALLVVFGDPPSLDLAELAQILHQ